MINIEVMIEKAVKINIYDEKINIHKMAAEITTNQIFGRFLEVMKMRSLITIEIRKKLNNI